MDLNAESMRLERLGVRGRWRRYWPTTTQQESPPACWPRGLGVGPPRVRGRKMRLGEVTQALRRREAIMPAAPRSVMAPGAGTAVKDRLNKVPLSAPEAADQ
jgi:hypothetical protein